MKYPMLIGRKFLSERFLVDVSQEYLTKAKLKEDQYENLYIIKK